VKGLDPIVRSLTGGAITWSFDDTARASTKMFEGSRDDGNRLNDPYAIVATGPERRMTFMLHSRGGCAPIFPSLKPCCFL